MAKKIFVTGADGFIGSHLVDKLTKEGYVVKALSLYNSFNNIGWLADLDKTFLNSIEIVSGDIRDSNFIRNEVKGSDIVFHLASLIAIPYSYHAPESYIDTNIKGTFNVLQSALDYSVGQVIHTSTSEVYGSAQFVPITEDHPLVGQSPYSASKIGADQMAHAFFCSYGLPVSTVRPFNTYGPRQSMRAVIPTIINQVLAGRSELLLGNVDATRDFNFVYDTVQGMSSFIGNSKTFGQVINIGSGREVTIKNIVEMVSKISNIELNIIKEDERIRPEKSEVERLCADNKKAQALLNWKPAFTLEEGLERTYNWFKKNKNEMDSNLVKYVR